jgi:sortase (surface protein transpeptidase)
VAHRFGYLKWTNSYRRKNSFFNLPKLKNEDTIQILWRQRKYTYAVYAESEGTEINDYTADLVLYTCKDLSSDVRFFVYAKLLRI